MKLDPKNGTIVFLVDQSGSMSGQKMEVTKDALKLFLKSLPFGCKFDIVSFGSDFQYLQNPKTLEEADDEDLGMAAKVLK